MNLLIFGAGASYGSDVCGVPPLGNQLFNSLITFDRRNWGGLPEEYQKALRNDFEQGMHKLSIEHVTWLAPLQRSMASFFFSFTPRNENLYIRMSQLIKEKDWNLDGALVTLNYERMLPIALTHNNLQPICFPTLNEIQGSRIELCLPHGICNLFCGGIRASGISFSGVTFDGGAPECIVDPNQFTQRINSDSIPPIMSYFEPQKSNSSGNNFIGRMRERYRELVLNSSKIAVIGLKVRSFDIHIWNPLSQTDAEIIYCSGKQASVEFLNWCKQGRESKDNKILEGYFYDYFEAICEEIGIT